MKKLTGGSITRMSMITIGMLRKNMGRWKMQMKHTPLNRIMGRNIMEIMIKSRMRTLMKIIKIIMNDTRLMVNHQRWIYTCPN